MTPRLTSAMLVSALMRRVAAEGGSAAVLAKGDANAGAVLLMCMERGRFTSLRERLFGPSGYAWQRVGGGPDDVAAYVERRRARDPDLWLIELDIANAERFAAETIVSA